MALTLPTRAYSPELATKTGGTGIFADENLKLAKKCEQHLGRFVKVKLKSNGLKLERQIDIAFIKSVQRGQFDILTEL